MSDASIDYSVNSPSSTPATPEPRLVAPPQPPLSPNSASNILGGRPDIDAALLRTIANGLISTIRTREDRHKQEAEQLRSTIEDMQKRIEFFTGYYETAPDGYIENNHRFPTFTIPIPGSNGMSNPAKWIKLMEDGRVAGYSEVQGPSDLPTITDMYLTQSFNSTDPYEPMPCWFRRMLTGDSAHYHTLREEVRKLDNWAHLAEISRYRKLEDDICEAQSQINSLRADIEGWTQAKELCEGRIAAGRTPDLVAHLEGQQARHIGLRGQVRRPHWKDFKNGRGRPV
jgi:hypothetical protein